MEDNYIRTMLRNENLCQEYLKKAEQEFVANGNKHSKAECVLLQQAAMRCSEMANMSTGEERLHYQRRLQDLNRRIEGIVRILNPDAFKKPEGKKETAGKKGTQGSASSPSAPQTNVAVADRDVSGWFKEAPKHSFSDVSGMEKLKEQLKECISDSRINKLRTYLKMKNLRSYFFIGPPGCGKTYVIEAFAHELMEKDYKYLALVGSDILSKYVGEAEKIVTRLFEEAEENAPCIVFIDEIDGVCKNRSLPNLPEYAASITTAFLTGYNRINSSDKPIIFIGATNYPNQVDNAMLDRVELIRVPLPDSEARSFSFEHKFKDILKTAPGISFEQMAALTEGYNYRDIDRLTRKVKDLVAKRVMAEYKNEDRAIAALKDGSFAITRELFEQALNECLPTPKDDILRDLDEWEERFRKGMDE
ncbi:MAG: AAA family ATPase [Lachnospiraceae bacterium]|nr:AAA family ATPase [Lachnospiraceae bacterium]